ncbi:uncharacterized protein FIBRA_08458 [Fibroporia radiculosa]|uniref:Uncharacterized protein n=1 Tax=Fibroporia radiculosa TaxID=599839 RepID=J4GHG3_9APHY|nr:uncharacterized protein FIBRA_08458 [Fibroporia radiculosa]CCM06213.1 predicted protein [Fibroporia radiculosa]
MPLQLPGYYWDEGKNRYFPLSKAGPAGRSSIQSDVRGERPGRTAYNTGVSEGSPHKRRRIEMTLPEGIWRARESSRLSYTSTRRRRCIHDIVASTIALTSRQHCHSITNAVLTAFHTGPTSHAYDEPYSFLIGDTSGWLHSLSGTGENLIHARELNIASSMTLNFKADIFYLFMALLACVEPPRLNRHAKLSFAILSPQSALQAPSLIMASHLPGPQIMDNSQSGQALHWVNPVSQLASRGYVAYIVKGAAKCGVFLPDIDTGRGFQVLETGSDVLAVHLKNHLVYTGARNGRVDRFDTRLHTSNRQGLLEDRFQRTTSAITHLSIVRERELLLSTIRGDLEMHDLRFLRKAPLMEFSGHVNAGLTKLGIAVDPSEDFLFAAGQDSRIRVWSLRSGRQLTAAQEDAPDPRSGVGDVSLPSHGRSAPVCAMQVTESERGMCLWAASGGKMYQYSLGQRGDLLAPIW